jgi:Flp pilus assembly pilin Flp
MHRDVLNVPLTGLGFRYARQLAGKEAMCSIMRLLRDDSAAIEIEYGLCAAIFLVGIIAVLQLVGVLERL